MDKNRQEDEGRPHGEGAPKARTRSRSPSWYRPRSQPNRTRDTPVQSDKDTWNDRRFDTGRPAAIALV